jgi:hypothetical protein
MNFENAIEFLRVNDRVIIDITDNRYVTLDIKVTCRGVGPSSGIGYA